MTIIDRLHRNGVKQKEFRHIARFQGQTEKAALVRKRIADIYFLHRYAGWSYVALARQFGISPERARQITMRRSVKSEFTVCHPARSCMISLGNQIKIRHRKCWLCGKPIALTEYPKSALLTLKRDGVQVTVHGRCKLAAKKKILMEFL